jgi:hypothetical protein
MADIFSEIEYVRISLSQRVYNSVELTVGLIHVETEKSDWQSLGRDRRLKWRLP